MGSFILPPKGDVTRALAIIRVSSKGAPGDRRYHAHAHTNTVRSTKPVRDLIALFPTET